jgi:hypothetical protein
VNERRFYERVTSDCALPPAERHAHLLALHAEVLADYLAAVQAITPERAAEPVADGRTVQQMVGHIAEWERFAILSAGDILAGQAHPRMVTSVDGFVRPDGQPLAVDGIDAFNEYAAAQHTGRSWAETQALALDMALTLNALFSQPDLLSAERLEKTLPFRKRLHNGMVIRNIAMGWQLWLTMLEHEAVEHAADLRLRMLEHEAVEHAAGDQRLPDENGEP